MSATVQKETLGFQAEVKQLLKLMIHSLYSNKEIFLRELISNASDAVDKLRFEALADSSLLESDVDLKIKIALDKEKRTLTISDNGIGMSRQEVIENIGTIAKSGTQEFLKALSGDQAKDANLIGQFGVGFYSAFIVADKVTLITRRAGLSADEGVLWESAGEGEYNIENITKDKRGTDVILHLREDADELLNGWALRGIIRKYSDHIALPIVMKVEKEGDDITEAQEETVNQASALWARAKNEITKEQYDEFYKHLAYDNRSPLAYVHAKVEGKQEYIQLLYVPEHAPYDLWERERRHGIKLYVRRVFIMDDADQLMPNYLRFVKGVIDSNNLPLNVSREILQESKDVEAIRAGATKKVLGVLEDLAENDQEKYESFWKEFGRVIKEGIGEDYANRERIAKLMRFSSTHHDSETQDISFSAYVSRMKEGQEKIYYVTADSFAAAKNSPHLEVFRKKGIEVLLLNERVDEWWVANLPEFEGKALQSVAKGDLDLGKLDTESEKAEQQKQNDEFKDLTEKIKQALGDKVKEVRVTLRLTESPACLVADQADMSGNLERLLKAAGQNIPNRKPILEINPGHPIIQRLKYENAGAQFNDWSEILFNQSLLSEGGQLEDPASFVRKLNSLMLDLAGSQSK